MGPRLRWSRMDKLNLLKMKVRGEEKSFKLFRHLRSVVAHKGRYLGVVCQLQALPATGNESQPEMVSLNISVAIRDHGTLPRRKVTLYGRCS